MTKKKSVRNCLAVVLLASCFVVTQSGVTSAWTPTSPQGAVSVFGGILQDSSYSIAIDSSGNLYTTGSFRGTTDFNPGSGIANLTSTGDRETNVFVSKLDASGNYVWARSFGGCCVYGLSVAVDSSGNVYTTGYFGGTADFDPGAGVSNLAAVGSTAVFVSKLDASGNYVWAKKFDSNAQGIGYSVAVDSSGNVYTTGYFGGTADFDPGAGVSNLAAVGSTAVFVSKLDASGNYVWAKSFDGTGSLNEGYSVAVDSSGNVYTTGYFKGTTDFDPGVGESNLISPSDNRDVFVSKLDALGNYVWAKRFGGTLSGGYQDDGFSVAVDSSGNVYTTGEFRGAADFDPGAGESILTSTDGGSDVFVSKLDSSGNYVWAKQFRSTSVCVCYDQGYSVAVDSSGNVYTTGNFTGTADFDPGSGTANLGSVNSKDVFVSKLDSSGNYVWAKNFGGYGDDQGNSVAVDSSGNVYTTGWFVGPTDFDPGVGVLSLTPAGITDVFVSKLDASGNLVMPAPGAPTSVTATSAANAQSVVSWTAPSSAGAATITSYTVTSSPGSRTCAWTTGALSCTVTGLTNGTSYTFTVTATSASGTGSASDASSSVTPSTTPGVPTSVTATGTANTQSVVSWTAPSSTGGATITGYTVTSSPDSRTCAWTTGALSCTVTGLTNGTSYTFSVTATNASGTGSASDASSLVIPSTTPGVPTSVSATSAEDVKSVVSWTAPSSTGGATITGYTATSSPGSRTCAWTTGALSCTVTGLTNGTSYTFTVTATNASGTGSASDASRSITPTAPQSITFATVGTQLLGKKTVALSATAASSLAVSFTSATPTVCTVSGATVTMLKLGDCTINADQSGGSGWNAAPQVSKTFIILPSPPAGAVGISIANGDPYTNTKKVVLNLVWPEYATAVRISNDGGFAASQTQTRDLTPSINWNLDDRVKGIVPKIVYVRFDGAVDNSKQYSDDIILDTTAPTIETLSAAVVSSSVTLSLKATDDITGVDKVEIRNDTKTVTKDYAARVSVPLVDLLLSVSSSGVRKSATTGLEIRVSDNAGNWTGWETVTVAGLTKTPVTTPTVITPKLTTSKSATVKSIAAYARLAVLSTSKVSLKVVSSSSKYCKVSGATLKGLAAGSCKVTVTVTPKKGRATSKTVTLKVSK